MENLGHREVRASAGFEVIQEALQEAVAEEGPGPVRAVDWDQSLVELSHAARCPIPSVVQSRWCQARERADCGLLPEVQHAWVSVDSELYLWDYCRPGGTLLTLPADSAICSVALSVPRAGVFEATLGARPRFVLVVATRLTVSLTGIIATGFQAPPPLQTGSPSRGTATGEISLRDWDSEETGRATAAPQAHGSSLQLVPLQGFSAPCDHAVFHRIRATPEGRIFLLSGAPHLHELRCLPRDGWFQCKCRLVRHFVGLGAWWQWPAQRHLASPGRLRLLECSSQGHVLLGDDRGTLRLCFASDSLGDPSFGEPADTLQELALLTAPQLANQARSLTQSHLASLSLTHLFPGLGLSGQLQLDASTVAGERLHFALSKTVADVSGEASQVYGFWLQQVSGSLASTVGQGTAPEPRDGSGRVACLEEHFDPCSFTPGCSRSGSSSALGPVWLRAALRPQGAGAADLAVSVRMEHSLQGACPGQARTLELRGLLSFDAPVLEVVPESPTQHGERFVVFLADRLEEVTLTRRAASAMRRAPANATECCAYLTSLAKTATSSASTGLPKPHYDWLFTLDDARYPGYEEQQRTLQLQQTVPRMIKGRWLAGFLQFLAVTLRPIWNRHFLVACARSVPVHGGVTSLLGGFCNKRQRCLGPAALAFSEQQATRILGQLSPVIEFVKDGLSTASDSQVGQVRAPSSAPARARLFADQPRGVAEAEARQRTAALPAPDQARRLLAQSLDVLDRVGQLLALAALLPQSTCLQVVLDASQECTPHAPFWSALLRTPFRDMVRSPECLAPAAELCTSLILQEGPEASDGFCRMLQESCPAIFSQVDLSGSARGRYVRPTSAGGDRWDALVQTVSTLATEDPKVAAELCAERLLPLPAEGHASAEQALALLEAFLDGLGAEHLRDGQATDALEKLLAETGSWRLEEEPGDNAAPQPLVHSIVVDQLLAHAPRFTKALEALWQSKAVDLEALLRTRSVANLAAREQLCRYYQHRGMKSQAKEQLLQLAECPDKEVGLRERIRHLEMAQEQETQETQAKDSGVAIRLDVGRKLQLPLFLELESLAADPHIDVNFREEAAKQCERLQGLRDLKELYEAALQLGLFHHVLSTSAVAGATLEPAVVTSLWLGLFFPPSGCAYSLQKSTASLRPDFDATDLFPLLLRRKRAGFLGEPAAMPRKLASHDPKDQLREKVLQLLAELREVAKPSGSLWDVRSVCTVLEYSNCLWLRAVEQTARTARLAPKGGDSAAGSPLCEESRLWVALEVLTAPPFEFTLADLVAFYAELIAHLDSWAKDLQTALPLEFREKPGLAWALPSEEDLHVHLAQVSVLVTGRWLRQVESLRNSPGYSTTTAAAEFASVWLRHADGLLAGLSLRLNSLQLSRGPARALLSEVLCLEKAGRRLCEGVVQAPLSRCK
eukprot:TRINITY_DN41302_c0_g1_i1.p1 TRINITY_DN41302_c0_g1~~TRINITY_DN41302_c0_g1_i1.p1  ORF type:complete len:1429 (-),score=243.59 TRINITY_DN41302_c0_g1_i1:70-4329(-)